ncbi:MAG TPA: glycosyltransferase [Pseudonocardiaceae bacterium]
MRIVQLANFYTPTSGGLRTAVDTIGHGYLAKGHERVLIVPGRHRTETAGDHGLVITLPGVPVSGGYRMVPRPASVLRELDRLRPDSVEVSDKATMVTAGDWARRHRAGAVLFSHERLDTWLAARAPWLRTAGLLEPAVARWNRRLAARFDVVAVTSAFAEDEFARLGVRSIHRVQLGVDLATFRPGPRLSDNGPTRLAYASRLSPEKNPGAVIEAVKVLVRNGTDVSLDVYGTGSALAGLRRAAVGLPVTFHGYVAGRAALADRLAAADVAFAPSAAETFGLSVLEALACGTPVVTADTGGAGELLAPGAGVAVPATGAGIAAGVTEIVSWPVAARRAAARTQAERFPWSATVDSMLRLHTTVADDDVVPTARNEVR